jgi:hypothetical protein
MSNFVPRLGDELELSKGCMARAVSASIRSIDCFCKLCHQCFLAETDMSESAREVELNRGFRGERA